MPPHSQHFTCLSSWMMKTNPASYHHDLYVHCRIFARDYDCHRDDDNFLALEIHLCDNHHGLWNNLDAVDNLRAPDNYLDQNDRLIFHANHHDDRFEDHGHDLSPVVSTNLFLGLIRGYYHALFHHENLLILNCNLPLV